MKKSNIFPPTAKRVCMRTDPKVNADIRNQTIRNVNIYKNGDEADITDRIGKLNQEWDTERILEADAALLVILSSYLGIRTNKIWYLLTGTVAVFMLQHAFWGWCPLMPFVRKWGVRTVDEINNEKTALKLFRGDFKTVPATAEEAVAAAEKQ